MFLFSSNSSLEQSQAAHALYLLKKSIWASQIETDKTLKGKFVGIPCFPRVEF